MNICEQLELVVGNDPFCHCARLKVWLNAQFASELFAVASGVWQILAPWFPSFSIQLWTMFSPIFVGEAIPLQARVVQRCSSIPTGVTWMSCRFGEMETHHFPNSKLPTHHQQTSIGALVARIGLNIIVSKGPKRQLTDM